MQTSKQAFLALALLAAVLSAATAAGTRTLNQVDIDEPTLINTGVGVGLGQLPSFAGLDGDLVSSVLEAPLQLFTELVQTLLLPIYDGFGALTGVTTS